MLTKITRKNLETPNDSLASSRKNSYRLLAEDDDKEEQVPSGSKEGEPESNSHAEKDEQVPGLYRVSYLRLRLGFKA